MPQHAFGKVAARPIGEARETTDNLTLATISLDVALKSGTRLRPGARIRESRLRLVDLLVDARQNPGADVELEWARDRPQEAVDGRDVKEAVIADIPPNLLHRHFRISDAGDLLPARPQLGAARLRQMRERLDQRGRLARTRASDHHETRLRPLVETGAQLDVSRRVRLPDAARHAAAACSAASGCAGGTGVISCSKIGRASCRERVCQYVYISVGAVSLKK